MTDAQTFADIFIAMGQRVIMEEDLRKTAEYNLEIEKNGKSVQIERAISAERLSNQYQEKYLALNKLLNEVRERLNEYENVKSTSIRQLKEIERLEKLLSESEMGLREQTTRNDGMEERIGELIDKLDRMRKKARTIISAKPGKIKIIVPKK